MDKFSEYLSVKIGIIVAGGYVALNVYFGIMNVAAVFAVATLISFALWLAVWDFSAAKNMPAYKHRIIFVIHVAASVIPPAVGVFYITYMAGGTA